MRVTVVGGDGTVGSTLPAEEQAALTAAARAAREATWLVRFR